MTLSAYDRPIWALETYNWSKDEICIAPYYPGKQHGKYAVCGLWAEYNDKVEGWC